MADTRLDDLLPDPLPEGRLDPWQAELFSRYWDERDSEAANLEAIGYWLAVSRPARDEQASLLP